MTSLPTFLVGDTATGFANGALLGVAGLALVLGTVLALALWRSTGNTRRAHMETARLRRIYEPPRMAPRRPPPPRGPMPRPGPPAEPTQAFAADTQLLPTHQPPPRKTEWSGT